MEGDEHMQLSMPEKETSRLYLRGMEEADACDIYDYYRQACVTQFLTFPPHPDVEHTLHILKAFYLPYERRGEPQAWCMLDKQREKVIGHVCFHALEDDTAQLAYVLHPEYWGHGYIREALLPLLEVGFTQFGLRRITAMVAYENKRSAKVLETLGFRLEGICKEAMKLSDGIYHDMMLYAILKKEWRKLYEQNT